MPTLVSEEPQMLTLGQLISAELSTYIGVGVRRIQDYADLVKLIEAKGLARDFGVDPRVRNEYQEIWDGLHEPGKAQ